MGGSYIRLMMIADPNCNSLLILNTPIWGNIWQSVLGQYFGGLCGDQRRPPSTLYAPHPFAPTGESPAQEPARAVLLRSGLVDFLEKASWLPRGPPGEVASVWHTLRIPGPPVLCGALSCKAPDPQGTAGVQVKLTCQPVFKTKAVGPADLTHHPPPTPLFSTCALDLEVTLPTQMPPACLTPHFQREGPVGMGQAACGRQYGARGWEIWDPGVRGAC